MALQLAVYENGDHTFLMWSPSDGQPIPECLGFAIEKTVFAGGVGTKSYLPNYVDFGGYQSTPLPHGQEWQRPFQRFLWWDYQVRDGDVVAYRVIPVLGDSSGSNLKLDEGNASALSPRVAVTGQFSRCVSAYFNKGIIAAQWVSRELAEQAKALQTQGQKNTMTEVLGEVGNPLRDALGGLLKLRIIQALNGVKTQGGSIYAALYELNDPELMDCLKALGTSANLILANGAFKPAEPDENAVIRQQIRSWQSVNVYDRMVSSGHFAHNKFVVFCDKTGQPRTVLTGSTNWTKTGLCTQANNAMFIQDDELAAAYLNQWRELKAAKNAFPGALVQSNSSPKEFTMDDMKVNVWFTPTSALQDMNYARSLIQQASDGILFLFFNPGNYTADAAHETLLQTVVEAGQAKPALYVRGVVNQRIAVLTDAKVQTAKGKAASNADEQASPHDSASAAPVLLYGSSSAPTRTSPAVLVPAAIKKNFAGWESELLSMGVMVHSKVIVLDPFGSRPVVMTGSHNLGTKASHANDDNLVILEGEGARAVAVAYALNIIAIYQEYRWRNYVAAQRTGKPWEGLVRSPDWQVGHLADRADRNFWMAGIAPPAASPITTRPASAPRGQLRSAQLGNIRPQPKDAGGPQPGQTNLGHR